MIYSNEVKRTLNLTGLSIGKGRKSRAYNLFHGLRIVSKYQGIQKPAAQSKEWLPKAWINSEIQFICRLLKEIGHEKFLQGKTKSTKLYDNFYFSCLLRKTLELTDSRLKWWKPKRKQIPLHTWNWNLPTQEKVVGSLSGNFIFSTVCSRNKPIGKDIQPYNTMLLVLHRPQFL